jgi:hypothetical protein
MIKTRALFLLPLAVAIGACQRTEKFVLGNLGDVVLRLEDDGASIDATLQSSEIGGVTEILELSEWQLSAQPAPETP